MKKSAFISALGLGMVSITGMAIGFDFDAQVFDGHSFVGNLDTVEANRAFFNTDGRRCASPEIDEATRQAIDAELSPVLNQLRMVDRATLLNETSSLMSQHLMQGRAAVEVIDELETLFEKRYHALIGKTVGEE